MTCNMINLLWIISIIYTEDANVVGETPVLKKKENEWKLKQNVITVFTTLNFHKVHGNKS